MDSLGDRMLITSLVVPGLIVRISMLEATSLLVSHSNYAVKGKISDLQHTRISLRVGIELPYGIMVVPQQGIIRSVNISGNDLQVSLVTPELTEIKAA